MSKINKVLSNIDQSDPSTGGFTEEEKARIRKNIGAISSGDTESLMDHIAVEEDTTPYTSSDRIATNVTSDGKGIIFKTIAGLVDYIKILLGIDSESEETLFLNKKGEWVTPQDTTYEILPEEDGGTNESLVSTGEKYIWNHKQNDIGIDEQGSAGRFLTQVGSWEIPPNTEYSVLEPEEGGTDASLVTTGDKFIWNKVTNILELIPSNASSENKLVTMMDLVDFGGFKVVPLSSTEPHVPDVAEPSEKMLYLTKDSSSSATDPFTEWIWEVDESNPESHHWQIIGEMSIDLSEYYKSEEVDELLNAKLSKNEISIIQVAGDNTKVVLTLGSVSGTFVTEHQDISGKQDVISDLQTIREGAAAGATAVQPEDLAAVATSGSYNDLSDTPDIPDPQIQSDWNQTDNEAPDYIKNKPDVDDVLIVLYGTGSINDIRTAVNAGKTVIAGRSSGGRDYYAVLSQCGYGSYHFTCIDGKSVQTWTVSPDGGTGTWSTTTVSIPNAQVNADWNAESGSVAEILNKPSLATVATSGSYDDLSNKPHIPADQVNADWNAESGSVAEILNKPSLATVATSGNYSDLSGTPNLAEVATSGDYEDLSNTPNLADVATSGDYEDLENLPNIPAGVKVLEYGVSTWQDFLDAYNKGYHLYVIWKDTSAQPNPTLRRIGQLSYVNVVNDTPDRAEFSYVRAKTSEVGSLIVYTLYTDSTWGTTSTKFVNMQDGTNTTVTRTNYNFKVNVADEKVVPAHTTDDAGKALRVDSNGDAVWTQDTMVVTAEYDYSQQKMVSNYTYDEIRDAIESGGNVRVIAYDKNRYYIDTMTLSHIDYGMSKATFQGINMGLIVKNDGTVECNTNLGLRNTYAPRRKYYTGWSIDMGDGREGNAPVLMISEGALCWYNVTVTGNQVKQDSCYSSISIRVPYGMEPTEAYTNDIYIKLTFNAWVNDRAAWSDWCGVELDINVRLGIPTETRSANTTMYTFSNGPLRWELSKKITFPSDISHNEYLLHIVGDTLEIKEYGS